MKKSLQDDKVNQDKIEFIKSNFFYIVKIFFIKFVIYFLIKIPIDTKKQKESKNLFCLN